MSIESKEMEEKGRKGQQRMRRLAGISDMPPNSPVVFCGDVKLGGRWGFFGQFLNMLGKFKIRNLIQKMHIYLQPLLSI